MRRYSEDIGWLLGTSPGGGGGGVGGAAGAGAASASNTINWRSGEGSSVGSDSGRGASFGGRERGASFGGAERSASFGRRRTSMNASAGGAGSSPGSQWGSPRDIPVGQCRLTLSDPR